MLSMLRLARCYQHGVAGQWQVVTLIAGSKQRSLLMAEENDEMFMTTKATKQHLVTMQRFNQKPRIIKTALEVLHC